MRNLFELDNNERERILEMHINATKKLYLIEQEETPTIDQIKSKLNEKLIVDNKRRELLKYGDTGTIILKNALMKSMVQGTDKPAFGRLLRRAKSTPSIQIPTELINYYLNTANNLIDDFKNTWNLEESKGKELKVVFTEKSIDLNKVSEPQETEKIKFEVDWNPDTNIDLYVNNEWDVTQNFENLFNERVIKPMVEIRKKYPNIQFNLLELSVETSASRYRNTGRAQNLTFTQLSGYRNNSAKDYIIASLNDAGVKETDTVTPKQTYLGSNGDGTTGPNPPEPNQYVDGGQVPMTQKPTEPRNQFGEPHQTPEEYDKYKYLRVKIVLVADFGESNPEESKITIFEYDYNIEYGDRQKITIKTIKKRRPPFKFPPFELIKGLSRIFKISPEKCAAYD